MSVAERCPRGVNDFQLCLPDPGLGRRSCRTDAIAKLLNTVIRLPARYFLVLALTGAGLVWLLQCTVCRGRRGGVRSGSRSTTTPAGTTERSGRRWWRPHASSIAWVSRRRRIRCLTSRPSLLDAAVAGLKQLGVLSPTLTAMAREAKEQAAWFRARKRLDDAAVAQAGAQVGKRAFKLRSEAAVMLQQDWARVFPGEIPPPL